MKLPYGVTDFYSLRNDGEVYVDRTDRIAVMEDLGKSLLFLRPRRFGKSLWLSTLANYYDVRRADEHERLFGDLAVGKNPTPLAHQYFVLRWDFSEIDPDPPPLGRDLSLYSRAQLIGEDIHKFLNGSVKSFLSDYRELVHDPVEIGGDAFQSLNGLLDAVRMTPYQIYLLIDEYDNFANEVLTADRKTYEDLVTTDGPFKRLFKWVKAARSRKGVDRVLMTGVSPMVMSDVTSGMNIARNVSFKPALADLCGFTENEIDHLLNEVLRASPKATNDVSSDDAKVMMREWYNGYRFSLDAPERIYNPTLVFYFLLELLEEGSFPRQMLDANLATDESKLEDIARWAVNRDADEGGIVDLVRKDEPFPIRQLLDRFTLKELLEESSQDTSFFGSYLFYLGLLTLHRETKDRQTVELVVPNEVTHGLYVERLRKILMPLGTSRSKADRILIEFVRSGEIEPLLDFVESTLFPTFSNRDAVWANELTVKTLFMTILWNEPVYIVHSEPELDHRYADLCLLRRPDSRNSLLWDLLFEFKRLSLQEVGLSSAEIKGKTRQDLMKLTEVQEAFEEAEEQLSAYEAALERRHGDVLRLRRYAVVALGFERLLVR